MRDFSILKIQKRFSFIIYLKMSNQTERQFLCKQAAQKLLEKYGSPLFVYDSAVIKQKVNILKKAAKNFHISYAMKANSNKEILALLRKEGIISVDVVSPGEIYKAINNSYEPHEILYTENFISEEEVNYAIKTGVRLNIGALDTLKFYGERLRNQEIFVRVNPELGAGENYNVITGGPHSKFGIYYQYLDEVIQVASQHNIKIVGLHQHIGSNLKKADAEIFLKATEFIFKIASKFQDVRYINIGGGIGIKYKEHQELLEVEQLYQDIEKMKRKYQQLYNKDLEIWIEPGRFLLGQSGNLLCRLTGKKSTPQKTFYGTDTGFNHLLRPALYNSYHAIKNLSNPNAKKQTVVVCGNVCQSTDNLGKNIELGGQIGDIICIENAGAYGFSMSSNYNERCKPAEILYEEGNYRVIRRRQTFQDLAEQI